MNVSEILEGKRILIVDDEPYIIDILSKLLDILNTTQELSFRTPYNY